MMNMTRTVRMGLRSLAIGLATLALVFCFSSNLFSTTEQTTLQSIAPAQAETAPPVAAGTNRFAGIPSGQVPLAVGFVPPQEAAFVDPTNYGDRFIVDANGNPVQNDLIVVLHETVGSANSALNEFQTRHPRDADQVSYHSLIRRNGTIVYLVPPEKRAFGAGNSVFVGANGAEAVRTNPAFPASVNNFAYHTSLESPSDGRGNQRNHSGYTAAQYRSLAWLVAQTRVPTDRITTHRSVDRSGTRLDPRSFDTRQFMSLLQTYSRG